MSAPTSDALAWVTELGAVEVARGRYAIEGAHTGKWRVLDAAKVAAGYTPTALTFQVSGVGMPDWWEPERRYAIKNKAGAVLGIYAFVTPSNVLPGLLLVTADLDTGAEVPA